MSPLVRHAGAVISLDRIIRHYRLLSHREPYRAAFWRQQVRNVITEYREQVAAPTMQEAA